jgi:hypothetical protein
MHLLHMQKDYIDLESIRTSFIMHECTSNISQQWIYFDLIKPNKDQVYDVYNSHKQQRVIVSVDLKKNKR